jgi:hypothetical protein
MHKLSWLLLATAACLSAGCVASTGSTDTSSDMAASMQTPAVHPSDYDEEDPLDPDGDVGTDPSSDPSSDPDPGLDPCMDPSLDPAFAENAAEARRVCKDNCAATYQADLKACDEPPKAAFKNICTVTAGKNRDLCLLDCK